MKSIYVIAIASRLLTIALGALIYCFTGSYDSSSEIQLKGNSFLTAFLRWDSLYFLHIADQGYVYEQETAFFPLLPYLARLATNTVFFPLQSVFGKRYTLLLSGVVFANASFILAAGTLYRLTLALMPKNKALASATAIAFCLSPPTMFMSAFNSESVFALLSFKGMYWAAQKRYLSAAAIWGIASAARSNAIIYSGFFIYDFVVKQLWHDKKTAIIGILKAIPYTLLTMSGFALFQYYGYSEFCVLDRPWCSSKLPLLYSFVQKEYWGNGFLSYYELKQIPNFLLAAPIIMISILGLKAYIQHDYIRFLTLGALQQKTKLGKDTFFSSSLLAHMYLWLFLLLFVTTSMHVQVIIRFFTSLPPLYWYIGHIWIKGFGPENSSTRIANMILGYFVFYGLSGIVLYSAFLPPA
ncbi:GPI mannosyltransferase 2 [Choanephora cucurbitarum]|uniref:GPI mannosyltransferase 2 n=1 Tax=Choanephora cucurbitarum TaxID=101091 RepID=A0A1C7NKU4_9FUNG|nr:GPI mannosyltransferase 2 [Choanephora cucurbitarum]